MSDDRYDLDSAVEELGARAKQRRASVAATNVRAGKVWLVYSLPRLLLALLVLWLVVLLHSIWPEYGLCRAWVDDSTGWARIMIPNTVAPNPVDCWTEARPNRELLVEDRLHTAPDGTLVVRFYELNSFVLNPNTMAALASVTFDRRAGGYRRSIGLDYGSLVVRTQKGIGKGSRFDVQTGGSAVSGFEATYAVDPGKVMVLDGEVTVTRSGKTWTAGAGQVMDLRTGKTRPLGSTEEQQIKTLAAKLPPASGPDRFKLTVVGLELNIVLRNSSWLLHMFGHKAGDGNPFVRFSLFNSSRRGQAQKRMHDIHTALSGLPQAPASVRLDDFGSLGVDRERIELVRQAFYRGQLMQYQASQDGRDFYILALANDRKHTPVTCTAAGVNER